MPHELKLWDYIPCSDFETPSSPTNESARHHSHRLWRWLRDNFSPRSKKDASNASKECERPFVRELDSTPIQADWDEAAEALAAKLNEWFEIQQPDYDFVRVLVGPPGCGISSALQALAQLRQFKTVSQPQRDIVLGYRESDIIASQLADESEDEIFVIPHLERFYLRHEDGLTLVRSLTERLMARRRVLLSCDSWAWAFLRQAIGIEDILGKPVTIAPFDAQRLDSWFRSNCDLDEQEFRQSHDGQPVFPPLVDQSKSDDDPSRPETSALIKSLSARARGNLGVALALWRHGLRTCEPDSGESASENQTASSVCWVLSPSELDLPKLATGKVKLHRFILHALLLHDGLSLSTLYKLLPFSRDDVRRRVSELRVAGILNERDETLRVALTAYPDVRQDLLSNGFLADAF